MVLVHGGGGTAFAWWVRKWNELGYAAIAIDTSGTMPSQEDREGAEPLANPQGGPKGSDHCFTQLDDPIEDQWAYHGTANIILANSFLRALPGVDADRIGLTGISWGGYLTCIAVGVDPRFRFAVPVYGCGFLAEDSGWNQRFIDMTEERREKWKSQWDPSRYLPNARMPMLWINGDMDDCFSLKIMKMSFLLPTGERYLSIQPGMGHSHTSGQAPMEIQTFAEQILHDGRPLAQCAGQGIDDGRAWATFKDVGKAKAVQFVYTTDAGQWLGRKWTPTAAEWDAKTGRASFKRPADATAWYFVVTDDRGLMASSEPVD
jgi:pimeloyl-ACP methyl ester carboxylesterase